MSAQDKCQCGVRLGHCFIDGQCLPRLCLRFFPKLWIEAGASELRPADVSNRVTHLADHNSRAIDDLLSSFRSQREKFLARLGKLSEDDFSRAALHGRLNVQMRLVDMLYFIAEHDDHHLDRMRSLAQEFS